MNWRIILAMLLFLAGAYTSVSFMVDSWQGRLCWDVYGGNYTRLPFATALRGATSNLFALVQSRPFTAVLELGVLTAFVWPISAALILNRAIVVLNAVLLTLLPFAINVHAQVTFGVEQYCTKDGLAELGFVVMQILVIPITILVIISVCLVDQISIRFAAYRATRRIAPSGGTWR
jgi:hypothetical protein